MKESEENARQKIFRDRVKKESQKVIERDKKWE